ncbi:MAG TPA: cobalamin-binding protein [Verrucomicrobiae bacterium]
MKPEHRIVSLLPSATEIACALGLGEQLLAITHCCDYPPEIEGKPRVVHSALPVEEMTCNEIDVAVSARLKAGESLYYVDEQLLRELAPTLLLTQDLCQVCAPAGNEVSRALAALPEKPKVVWMSPHSIADIQSDIAAVAQAAGREREAERLIIQMSARLAHVAESVMDLPRPRVFCAEWVDPLFCSGHWVPEQVEIAGGVDVLGHKWKDSVRITWNQVLETQPEVIIFMACGYNCDEAMRRASWLAEQPGFHDLPAVQQNRVYVVDAGYFSRPGPRVVDGAELVAHLLHPESCAWLGASEAFADFRSETSRVASSN